MVRVTIRLSELEHAAAAKEAARLGISLGELVRRSLWTVLPVDEAAPWMRLAALVESGDADSTGRIDEVVYGTRPAT